MMRLKLIAQDYLGLAGLGFKLIAIILTVALLEWAPHIFYERNPITRAAMDSYPAFFVIQVGAIILSLVIYLVIRRKYMRDPNDTRVWATINVIMLIVLVVNAWDAFSNVNVMLNVLRVPGNLPFG